MTQNWPQFHMITDIYIYMQILNLPSNTYLNGSESKVSGPSDKGPWFNAH